MSKKRVRPTKNREDCKQATLNGGKVKIECQTHHLEDCIIIHTIIIIVVE